MSSYEPRVILILKNGDRYFLPVDQWRGPEHFGGPGWVKIPWDDQSGETWVRRDQVIKIEIEGGEAGVKRRQERSERPAEAR